MDGKGGKEERARAGGKAKSAVAMEERGELWRREGKNFSRDEVG